MISIAMTYYNRFNLLSNTLRSISRYTHPDEIIIVDDASTIEPLDQKTVDLISWGMNVKLFRFEPEEKTWCNPCVAFNKAFSLCTGDIVVIQNSECYHKNNIIGHCKELDFEDTYYVFGCYSLPINADIETHTFIDRGVSFCGDNGWYQHSKYRNVRYHFTSAISRKNILNIRGFDENYANGSAYDDNEFLHRVTKQCNVATVDNFFTMHQFHYSNPEISHNPSNSSKYYDLVAGRYNQFKSSL